MKAPIIFLAMMICLFMALTYGQMQMDGGGDGERSPDSVIDPACLFCETGACPSGELYDKVRDRCVTARPPIEF
ncbi:hypothetical protein CHUAL_003188 [Chamberlinius hualienensis]